MVKKALEQRSRTFCVHCAAKILFLISRCTSYAVIHYKKHMKGDSAFFWLFQNCETDSFEIDQWPFVKSMFFTLSFFVKMLKENIDVINENIGVLFISIDKSS